MKSVVVSTDSSIYSIVIVSQVLIMQVTQRFQLFTLSKYIVSFIPA